MTAPAEDHGTAAGIWWRLPDRPGAVEELDAPECRRLLASASIGRLGYTGENGPRITPVNFLLDGDAVIFRTGQQSEVARVALGRAVAFEVDQIDEFLHSGWSVLVVGQLREMSFSEVQQLDPSRTPQPWAQGQRTLVCQIPLGKVTGRRVHPG
jgi:uncharacterized protein